MMNILLATYDHYPQVGGINTYMEQLQRGLEKKGHTVDILCAHPKLPRYCMPTKNLFVEKKEVYPVIYQKVRHFFEVHLSHLHVWGQEHEVNRYCFEAAAAFFGLEKYHIIHAQDVTSARAIARVKPKKTPLITTMHGCFGKEVEVYLTNTGQLKEEHKKKTLIEYCKHLECLAMESSNITLFPTRWMQNIMTQNAPHLPSARMAIVRYGLAEVPSVQKTNLAGDVVKRDGKHIIICPARLDYLKGHIHLLHALAQLKNIRTDWICWLVGDGVIRKQLEERCKSLNLAEHVVFLGDRQDVHSLLNSAEIFVLPSIQENHLFAVMEAQLAGKTAVACAIGGVPELIVHLQTGILFPPENPEELCNALKLALDDSGLRYRLAKQARQWGKIHYSLNTLISRLENIYQMEIQKSRQSG